MPRLRLRNCFWLLLPVLALNAVFASRLPQVGFKSDAGVPDTLLVAEQVLRMAGFLRPLSLPLRWLGQVGRAEGRVEPLTAAQVWQAGNLP